MSKRRDREYGPKPQDVELKREDLPQRPARLLPNYCKKGKAEHVFELEERIKHPWLIKSYSCMESYRCAVCGKKKHVLKRKEDNV